MTAPTQPGYAATMPANAPGASPDPGQVPALLAQAGYVQSGRWTRGGHTLTLVIAAPAGRQPYDAIAAKLKEQLSAAGIAATMLTPPLDQLYEQVLAVHTTTATTRTNGTARRWTSCVGPQPTGGDPATVLAAWFGCGPLPAAAGLPAAGPLGCCDHGLQPTVEAALTGVCRCRPRWPRWSRRCGRRPWRSRCSRWPMCWRSVRGHRR